MAYFITSDCINCTECVFECPNDAISLGEHIHEIDAGKCTECVGFHKEPQCVVVCATDCIVHEKARAVA
ncbi:MAG: 4Fe-4S binding protein [Betaproteobacteria bacterium]|nr:4Fe-4S binding protein [Betaproteobacteria bacterium]